MVGEDVVGEGVVVEDVAGEDVAGEDVVDTFEGLVNDVVAESLCLCLDPKTIPSTAASMTTDPTAPPYSIHCFLEG